MYGISANKNMGSFHQGLPPNEGKPISILSSNRTTFSKFHLPYCCYNGQMVSKSSDTYFYSIKASIFEGREFKSRQSSLNSVNFMAWMKMYLPHREPWQSHFSTSKQTNLRAPNPSVSNTLMSQMLRTR